MSAECIILALREIKYSLYIIGRGVILALGEIKYPLYIIGRGLEQRFASQLFSPPKHAPSDDFVEISKSELTEVVDSIPSVVLGLTESCRPC